MEYNCVCRKGGRCRLLKPRDMFTALQALLCPGCQWVQETLYTHPAIQNTLQP